MTRRRVNGTLGWAVVSALLVFSGCREREITPTTPTTITLTPSPTAASPNSNTNNNDNDVDINIIITFPPAPTPPTPPPCCDVPIPTPTPTPPSGQIRTPDPPFGSSLPLPSYTPAVVQEIHAANPQLILSSCIAQFGVNGWAFLDKMVDRLRLNDTRWGYACAGLDCNNPSGELLAYHATAGPDVMGAQGIITVDIIDSYCVSPAIGFINRGFDPLGRWSTRNRF